MDDLPDCLRVSRDDRRASWDNWLKTHRYTDARTGPDADSEALQRLQAARRAAIMEERKARAAAALAQLKNKHEGERYDTKLKIWVRDPKLIEKLQEAEFAEHANG
jgi:hypothetical protein